MQCMKILTFNNIQVNIMVSILIARCCAQFVPIHVTNAYKRVQV